MRFDSPILKVCLATLFLTTTQNSWASLTFVESTRLIFDGNKKAAIFPVKNRSNLNYLLKASIFNAKENGRPGLLNKDFIVLPEVLMLKPNSSQYLRILRVAGQYPTDRESVFFINGFYLPEQTQKTKTTLNLAMSINVKMFYRPEAIKDQEAIKRVSSSLSYRLEKSHLIVTNPSPYFLTFHSLSIGKHSFSDDQLIPMIPPFGEKRYTIDGLAQGEHKVSWSLIDEFGNKTDDQYVVLKVN